MLTTPRILYPHAWFARTGTAWATPTTGTVGVNAKPPVDAEDASSNELWVSLGRLAGVQETPSIGTRKEIWTGSPGKLVLGAEIATKLKQEIVATCQDLNEIALQLLYATSNLDLDLTDTDKQFNPLAGTPLLEGWLKIQYYDHDNNAILFVDRWGGLSFEGSYNADGDNNEFTLKHTVYHSQYNTGEIEPS
jgi:hypothetical protein